MGNPSFHRAILPLLTLAAGFALAPRALAVTEVCGTFSLATEWTAAESPYLVTGDIFIPTTSRLRIGPGVEVRFVKPRPCPSDKHPQPQVDWSDSAYTSIKVEGTFYCIGTEDKPVVFASAVDGSKDGVGWDGLRFTGQNANGAEIGFAVFSGANNAIVAERTDFFVHHTLFQGNNTAILLGFRGDLSVVNCDFIGNHTAGIVIRKAGPRLANNIFADNHGYGVWADGRPVIQIMNNAFWRNREEDCYKCPYQVLDLNGVNGNKDSCDAFQNLRADPVFMGSASFDSAQQADVNTDTPDHLVKDAKLAKLEADARKQSEKRKRFQPMGKGEQLLSKYSRLIDAGHSGREFRDRDGSANDIGRHGGPMARMTKDPF